MNSDNSMSNVCRGISSELKILKDQFGVFQYLWEESIATGKDLRVKELQSAKTKWMNYDRNHVSLGEKLGSW